MAYFLFRFKGKQSVTAGKRCGMFIENNIASLNIVDTTQEDASSYTCEASNDFGTVTSTAFLEIWCKCFLDDCVIYSNYIFSLLLCAV